MTVLALKMASHCNGVSKLHGQVSRRMWRNVWPGVPEEEIPKTRGQVAMDIPKVDVNAIDAAARGASEGMALALNVGAMLLAFIGLLALVDFACASAVYLLLLWGFGQPLTAQALWFVPLFALLLLLTCRCWWPWAATCGCWSAATMTTACPLPRPTRWPSWRIPTTGSPVVWPGTRSVSPTRPAALDWATNFFSKPARTAGLSVRPCESICSCRDTALGNNSIRLRYP